MSGEIDIFQRGFSLPQADRDLADLYGEVAVPVDRLAYTPDFDRLYERYRDMGHPMSRTDVFRRLLMLRKAGLLPRLFQSGVPAGASP